MARQRERSYQLAQDSGNQEQNLELFGELVQRETRDLEARLRTELLAIGEALDAIQAIVTDECACEDY